MGFEETLCIGQFTKRLKELFLGLRREPHVDDFFNFTRNFEILIRLVHFC
jgi:hypothetical protein